VNTVMNLLTIRMAIRFPKGVSYETVQKEWMNSALFLGMYVCVCVCVCVCVSCGMLCPVIW
jgi:hypothetical protein